MDTFTVRDLREHTGKLIHDAEKGKLSLITKRGTPVFLAVPFTEEMVSMGLPLTLAASLYKEGMLTLEKAARLAHQNLEAFIETLGKLNIPVANYSANELRDELKSFK